MKHRYPLIFFLFLSINLYCQNDFNKKSFSYTDSLFIKDLKQSSSIKYIDSALFYAKKTKDNNQLSYVNSSIAFYYNKTKKFEKALFYFEKSNDYAKKDNNQYIINSNYYGISLIYFQIGNYKESEFYLIKAFNYFIVNQNTQSDKLALLNILNRLTFIYLINNDLSKAKYYNQLEFKYVEDSVIKNKYPYMYSFTLKNKGIIYYKDHNYKKSINILNESLIGIKERKSNYWLSIIYMYLGDNYLQLNDEKKAYLFFSKMDSIYKIEKDIDISLRNGLEKLVFLNKKNKDLKKQLSSVDNLIEFDSLLNTRNINLSNELYNEYVNKNLKKEKNQLERQIFIRKIIIIIVIIISILIITILIYFLFFIRKKQKETKIKFEKIIDTYINKVENLKNNKLESDIVKNKIQSLNIIDQNKINEILNELDILEKSNFFINTEINLKITADKIGTNTKYLSYVINTVKNKNFPLYINEIRINYIVKEIIENSKLRNLSLDGIANRAGFKTRQKFSQSFFEVTGVKPTYFISNIDKYNNSDIGKDFL